MPRFLLTFLLGVWSLCASAEPTQEQQALALQISMTLIEVYQKAIVAPVILLSCESRSAAAQELLDDESLLGRWALLNTSSLMQAWPLDEERGEEMVRKLQSLFNEARSPAQMHSMRQEVLKMDAEHIAELCGEMESLATRVAQSLESHSRWASRDGDQEDR